MDTDMRMPIRQRERPQTAGNLLRQHKSLFIIALLLLILGLSLGAGYYYIVKNYAVTTIYVAGNIHHTNEEIMELVMAGKYGHNSLYLSLKYKDKSIEGIPFIEKMDVNILSRNTIKIDVYEKAIAGYVEYLGNYLYFDKDGIIVESSFQTTAGIPQVTGLEFSHAVMHERLPVADEAFFSKILNITQLLGKYQVAADRIYFNDQDEVTLYFGEVKVALGSDSNMDEKVMELQDILPNLAGKAGTLRMENADGFSGERIFESES